MIRNTSDFKRRQNEEIKVLQERYDTLKAIKERAAERYKADYKKWRDFSKWIFAENDQHRKHRNEQGISKEEKKRRDLASIMRKRQKMVELGPNLARFEGEPEDIESSHIYLPQLFKLITFPDYTTPHNPPPIGGTEPDEDKENDQLSSPSGRKSKDNIECHATSSSPLRVIQPGSTTKLNPPSSSPNVFLTTPEVCSRNTRRFLPPNGVKPEPQRTALKHNGTKDKLRPRMPCSSDTEDDSQGSFYPFFQ